MPNPIQQVPVTIAYSGFTTTYLCLSVFICDLFFARSRYEYLDY